MGVANWLLTSILYNETTFTIIFYKEKYEFRM